MYIAGNVTLFKHCHTTMTAQALCNIVVLVNIATRSNLFRHHCHVVTTIYAKLEHENFRREKVLKKAQIECLHSHA